MRLEYLAEYRKLKGIRQPARFCSKGEIWVGNVYAVYGTQKRIGNPFADPVGWEMF